MSQRAARARLDRLWQRGRDFLGSELAIMGGAMTWVSERNLVAAISNAGGFGPAMRASLKFTALVGCAKARPGRKPFHALIAAPCAPPPARCARRTRASA